MRWRSPARRRRGSGACARRRRRASAGQIDAGNVGASARCVRGIFGVQSAGTEARSEAVGGRAGPAYRMKRRLPRMRLVALSTANAAPRAGRFRSGPSRPPGGRPLALVVARDTMMTVASNARTALTPSSSKSHAALHRLAQRLDAGLGRATKFTGLGGQPFALPGKRLGIPPGEATFARQRPLGRRSSTNSAKRRRSLRGFDDMDVTKGQALCQVLGENARARRIDRRSAWAKRAALEAEESGYVTHKVRARARAPKREDKVPFRRLARAPQRS